MLGHCLPLSGIALLGAATAATAASCPDGVAQLAGHYDLRIAQTETGTRGGAVAGPGSGTSAPPMEAARRPDTGDMSGPSGGTVTLPTTVDRGKAIELPHAGPNATPPQPSLPPQSAQGGGSAGGAAPPAAQGAQADARQLSAATRSQAEALLQAARAADAQGKSEECFRRLGEAQALVSGSEGRQ